MWLPSRNIGVRASSRLCRGAVGCPRADDCLQGWWNWRAGANGRRRLLKDNYEQHVDNLKVRLKAKGDASVEALEENFGTSAEFGVPSGGIYL